MLNSSYYLCSDENHLIEAHFTTIKFDLIKLHVKNKLEIIIPYFLFLTFTLN